MNSPSKIALGAAGALAVFAVAYVGFGLARGADPSEMPVLGALFTAPRSVPGPRVVDSSGSPRDRTPREPAPVLAASASILDAFQLPSPYEASELAALVEELERAGRAIDARAAEVATREERAADRERWLDDRYAELTRLRAELERWQGEIDARERDLQGAAPKVTEQRDAGWQTLAKLFADGDPAELATRLFTYSPADAAQLLRAVRPARAKELLEALPSDKWREYADAYRSAEPNTGE